MLFICYCSRHVRYISLFNNYCLFNSLCYYHTNRNAAHRQIDIWILVSRTKFLFRFYFSNWFATKRNVVCPVTKVSVWTGNFQTGKLTVIKRNSCPRGNCVYRHHGNLISCPPEAIHAGPPETIYAGHPEIMHAGTPDTIFSNVVFRGLRSALNWFPIMLRDVSLSDSQCNFSCLSR